LLILEVKKVPTARMAVEDTMSIGHFRANVCHNIRRRRSTLDSVLELSMLEDLSPNARHSRTLALLCQEVAAVSRWLVLIFERQQTVLLLTYNLARAKR
jgi:hypothetical protein